MARRATQRDESRHGLLVGRPFQAASRLSGRLFGVTFERAVVRPFQPPLQAGVSRGVTPGHRHSRLVFDYLFMHAGTSISPPWPYPK